MGRVGAFITHERGAAAAEMALILPLALALLFTMLEGAWYILCEHRVIKGVRDGARYAARLDFANYGCPGGTFNGSALTVQKIKNLTRTGQLELGEGTVPGWADKHIFISVSCTSEIGGIEVGGIYAATGNYAPKVRIHTTVPFPSLLGSMGFGSATWQIQAAAESPVTGI